jgi:hypothetical protein
VASPPPCSGHPLHRNSSNIEGLVWHALMSLRSAWRLCGPESSSLIRRLLRGYILRPLPQGYFLHPPLKRHHSPHRLGRPLPRQDYLIVTRSSSHRYRSPNPLAPTDGPTPLSPGTDRESSLAFRNRHHATANSDIFYHHWRPNRPIQNLNTLHEEPLF